MTTATAKSTELVLLETVTTKLFKVDNGLESILASIEDQCKDLVFDVSTVKGRKEVTAMCTKITTAKTNIESIGAPFAKEVKALPKIIDANRKEVKTRLDALKSVVRSQLTIWEDDKKKADELKVSQERLSFLDTQREVAVIIYNDELREKAELLKVETEKQNELDRIERERVANEAQKQAIKDKQVAELRQKQAEVDAIEQEKLAKQAQLDLAVANAKAKEDAVLHAKQQEALELHQKNEREFFAIESAITQLQTMTTTITRCINSDELTVLAKRSGELLKLDFKDRQDEANRCENEIVSAGKARRAHLLAESLVVRVGVVFPDNDTCKLVMNDIIDCVLKHGLLYAKQSFGEIDTLVVTKPTVEQVKANEWGLS